MKTCSELVAIYAGEDVCNPRQIVVTIRYKAPLTSDYRFVTLSPQQARKLAKRLNRWAKPLLEIDQDVTSARRGRCDVDGDFHFKTEHCRNWQPSEDDTEAATADEQCGEEELGYCDEHRTVRHARRDDCVMWVPHTHMGKCDLPLHAGFRHQQDEACIEWGPTIIGSSTAVFATWITDILKDSLQKAGVQVNVIEQ